MHFFLQRFEVLIDPLDFGPEGFKDRPGTQD
jgi:hypothetical protein